MSKLGVQALRNGVSETSVRAAAGWSSGAMVARYTRALSGELAFEEFQKMREFVRPKSNLDLTASCLRGSPFGQP